MEYKDTTSMGAIRKNYTRNEAVKCWILGVCETSWMGNRNFKAGEKTNIYARRNSYDKEVGVIL